MSERERERSHTTSHCILKLYNVYHKLTDKVEIRYDMPVLSVNGNELATQIKGVQKA
jgi:hypothetical protein